MKFRLPGRVPLRLRVFFRGAFALLALATLALALGVLQDEKQRSLRNYADGLRKSQAQIAARLRNPSGQLALLNPGAAARPPTPVRPLLLPFSALDFDDRNKAQQAVEMAGCALQYPDGATLCAGVGSNPYAGGFVYLVGSFASSELVAHAAGERDLASAHRVAVDLQTPAGNSRWLAPYEVSADGRGRLTGFEGAAADKPNSRPQRDFRGWLWQDGRCLDGAAATAGCLRRSFMSIRLPVAAFRDALAAGPPPWPPANLDRISVHVRVLPPSSGAALFDSDTPGAALPFSVAELAALLLPGEQLHVQRASDGAELLQLRGASAVDAIGDPIAPWVAQLIRRLPVDGFDAPQLAREVIATPQGRYELLLQGDVRSVNQGLAAVATRLSWLVGAMLLAVLLTWLAIELRIIRRVTLLTRRAAAASLGVKAADGTHGLASLDLSDLRSSDELGVLAQGLSDLLQRVNADLRREQIRAAQERDMWHAVGHEIMSPLQSLMALMALPAQPGQPAGPAGQGAQRYITRMQQAVRVLYGQASPSEAFAATTLALQPLDLDAFLRQVAGNAGYIGIHDVAYAAAGTAVMVRADEHSLEDVVTHVLRNAERHRTPATPIRLALRADADQALVTLHNQGPAIAQGLLERIFEYGVSDAGPGAGVSALDGPGAAARRGQGLFVARTYMAKMGGTIVAINQDGGVSFALRLPLAG